MGKIVKQVPKESQQKQVKKTITKLQKLKKITSSANKLKRKTHRQIKAPQHEYEDEDENTEENLGEEEEEDNENVEDEDIEEEVPLEEEKQEDNMEIEDNEEEVLERKSSKPATNLVKVLNPVLESNSIYTGGKTMLSSQDNELYCLCNNEIVVYSLDTQSTKRKITQENEEISNFVLHPSGKSIVYFTKNFLLRYVSLEDNSVQRLWKVQSQIVVDMAIDTTGRLLAIGFTSGIIHVYDLKKGNLTHTYNNHRGQIVKLEFHPQPQKLYLLSLSEDLTLRVYDLVVNSCVKTFQNFQHSPSSFTLLDDGINVLTSSYDLKINLYDLQQLSHKTSFSTDEEIAAIENIKVTIPKTKEVQTFLLIGGQSGVLKTLNLALDEPVIREHSYIKAEHIIRILKFKKTKRIILVTAEQNLIFLSYYITQDGELEFTVQNQIAGYNDEVIDIKFMKRRQDSLVKDLDYYAYCTNSSQIRVYYPQKKHTEFLWGHSEIVLCLDTHGDYIASGSKDNTIKLWFYENGSFRFLTTFKGHNDSVGTISFAPIKGNLLASGSSDKTIKLWSIAPLKKKTQEIELEEITSAKNTLLAHDKDINCVKFSPNEKFIATASQDRSIKVFQTNGLKLHRTFKGHKRGVWDVAFSPVEKVIASASGDNTVKIWNLVDGTCMKTLEGHLSPVLKVEWICYGLEVLSASADGLMKIWNVKKIACVNTLEKHEGKVWSLAVRQNTETGRYEVLSGDNNSTWMLWEDQTIEEEKTKKEEMNKKIMNEQQLWSLVREHKYLEAGKLAFDLNMIRNFKNLAETLLNKVEFKTSMIYTVDENDEEIKEEEGEVGQEDQLRALVEYCISKDIKRLFPIIRDLNTVSKYARISQRMLEIVLENVDFEDLDVLKKQYSGEGQEKGIKEYFEILLSYSERHFSRVQKYVTKSFYLDYVMKHSFMIGQGNGENGL